MNSDTYPSRLVSRMLDKLRFPRAPDASSVCPRESTRRREKKSSWKRDGEKVLTINYGKEES